ncbi:MAG: hypothetical protein ACRCTJ_03015 [Brevinema sp.]
MKSRIIILINCILILFQGCSSYNSMTQKIKDLASDTNETVKEKFRKKIANKTFITSKNSELFLNIILNNDLDSTIYFDKYQVFQTDQLGSISLHDGVIGQGSTVHAISYHLEKVLNPEVGIFKILYLIKTSSQIREVFNQKQKTILAQKNFQGLIELKVYNTLTDEYILFATEQKI